MREFYHRTELAVIKTYGDEKCWKFKLLFESDNKTDNQMMLNNDASLVSEKDKF